MKEAVYKVTFLPSQRTVTAKRGEILLDVLRRESQQVNAVCGGKGNCGKCKALVAEGSEAFPLTLTESRLLTRDEIAAGYRLSCQFKVMTDVRVKTEDSALNSAVSKPPLPKASIREISPQVRVEEFSLCRPDIDDQTSDYSRLMSALVTERPGIDRLSLLRRLPHVIRELDYRGRAVLYGSEVIDILPFSDESGIFGVAIDIGTTTLAVYLVDLKSGEIVAVRSASNPQSAYGQDVISRIDYAIKRDEGIDELRTAVLTTLNKLIDDLCKGGAVSKERIYDTSIVGNTTMIHILLGISPERIASSPFIPTFTGGKVFESRELDLEESIPNSKIYIMPGISAYVGSDITADILSSGFVEDSGNVLLVDIGTNGEMALKSGGRIFACSTAAGPAFEGGNISQGTIARPGAVDHVWLNGEGVGFSTVDGSYVSGICGSGLIDAIAVMMDAGVVSESGRIRGEHFELDGAAGKVRITRRDIREVQLAKAAIRAGVSVLMDRVGIETRDIDRILLAGAFGNYIDPENALRIGMLPNVPVERVSPVGNAAGLGAVLAVLDSGIRERAESLSSEVHYVELSGRKDFNEIFVENLALREG